MAFTLTRRGMIVAGVASLSFPAWAMKPKTNAANGLAISGYDPVAYFTLGEPTEGSPEFTSEYEGATWLFASADHKAQFDADPASFAPQYGGYCAYAVSRGYTAPISPDAWRIVDERLYLNYNKTVRALWATDIAGNISAANANWPKVLNN